MRTQRKAAGERVKYERRCQVLSCIRRRGWATQTQSWKWNEDLLTYWVVYGSSFCVITFESRARWELMWCKLLSPSDSSWQHDRNSFGQGIIRFVANARLHMFTSLTTTNNLEKLSRLFFYQDSLIFFWNKTFERCMLQCVSSNSQSVRSYILSVYRLSNSSIQDRNLMPHFRVSFLLIYFGAITQHTPVYLNERSLQWKDILPRKKHLSVGSGRLVYFVPKTRYLPVVTLTNTDTEDVVDMSFDLLGIYRMTDHYV